MHITPLDIRKQPFRKTFSGFDPDEVNSFLEMVANEFESLIRSNDELMSQFKSTEEKLSLYTKIEKTLNDTLVSAQRASDDARMNAQKEAELIIRDAQVRAGRYEDETRNRVHKLESDLASLKTQRDGFLARFKSLLKTQIELLALLNDDLKDDAKTAERYQETMAEIPSQPAL